MECYCFARNKPIRREITKPQTATVISLWFWGLLAYPELYCDWPVYNQHSWNFSGAHGFLSLTVILRLLYKWKTYKRRFDLQWTRPAFSRKYLQFSQIQYQSDGMAIERFHSRDQYLCKFMGTKESVHKKKRVQLPQDWFGTLTWPSFYCFGTPIWPSDENAL